MLSVIKLVFTASMFIVGIPGLLDDVKVWQRWFPAMTEWQWWNYILVGGGTLLFIQTAYACGRDISKKYGLFSKKELASPESQLLGSPKSFKGMHNRLEETLKISSSELNTQSHILHAWAFGWTYKNIRIDLKMSSTLNFHTFQMR